MRIKKILVLLLVMLLAFSVTGCKPGNGNGKGKKSTNVIYDINDSSNYCTFNTNKKTVTVVLYENIEGIGKTNLSSKKAVSYSGTYGAGKTVSFSYNCKFDNSKINVSITIPKSGDRATINYSY